MYRGNRLSFIKGFRAMTTTLVELAKQSVPSAVGRWITARSRGSLSGRSRNGPGRQRRWRAAFPMLFIFGAIWAGYMTIVVFVVLADPYDIYHWGTKPQLKQNEIPRDQVIRLIDVVSKKWSIDTFFVGGSTTVMYSPNEIAAALGGEAVAYNLSDGGPRPMDRDIVLDQLAENSRAKRIIITFEWMYILDPETMHHGFPEF